ncbi:sialidase family protein [Flavihumibacter sp. UBA7668]|uniref:sialidase family protein n=1 Tax=Flavihumibacter sp. UBA7668 TaxID=1946542 RepID=UPI0025BE6962|nr:sialidase family protein [Flavihumibacter sp. UBA7668]
MFKVTSLACLIFFPQHKLLAQQPDLSKVPGVVIAHRPAASKVFVGSPALVALKNGKYIASHDLFGEGMKNQHVTMVYESTDKGKSWIKIAEFVQFWSNLFELNGLLYMMGARLPQGDVVIRVSKDEGKTWTEPIDAQKGILHEVRRGYIAHTSAVPVVINNGRIYRAMEEMKQPGPWGSFNAFVMSAPITSDLLKSSSWTISNKLSYDSSQLHIGTAWLEGNMVVNVNGELVNILRVHSKTDTIAAVLKIEQNGRLLSFDTANGFIHLPGACKKFVIRKDPVSNKYWTLTNAIPTKFQGGNVERTRNTLQLLCSADLQNWEKKRIILQGTDIQKHGFQYADWQFENNDIILVSRTAYEDGLGGAENQHNANMITFHRIIDFRR